ncbi:hypothetical protein [Polyangium jinanense]|uniref:FecR protein domain-containing protein n=1 Tax=Polyangium jinanense TaxID=2829994 RepID=A0A9X3WY01_9BACT|nr:hypothetical protein [Polyangium jinanense]MDC3952715.1 hypothetical protein [Polyangium jinanense]MDC3980334.1 hypothetical protein [Polyangium jinanense]
MKTARGLVLSALVLAGGCAPAPPPARAESDAPPARNAPPEDLLVLADLRVLRGDEPVVMLYRNGLLVEHGETLGTLHSNGFFVDLGGTIEIRLSSDGTVPTRSGTLIIDEGGTATFRLPEVEPEVLRFDAEGRVAGAKTPLRVEGLTPRMRRTAMFALLLPDLLRLRRHDTIK